MSSKSGAETNLFLLRTVKNFGIAISAFSQGATMRILNYRTGFAANSSSTHSAMVVDNIEDLIEIRYGKSFAYTHFALKEKKSLLEYLGAQINSRISSKYYDSPQINKLIIDGMLGVELFKDINEYSYQNLSVENRCVWLLPHQKGSKFISIPHPELIKDLKDILLRENFVIRGYQSYEDEPRKIVDKFDRKKKVIENLSGNILNKINVPYGCWDQENWFCYKEDGVWRFYDHSTGTKIRFSMDGKIIPYATTPELIDLIVTDRCDNACDYCYRGCTNNGFIANFEDVEILIKMICMTNTPEISIGGGDILEYPDLDKLLELIGCMSRHDVIFTTTINFKSLIKHGHAIDNTLLRMSKVFNSIAISVENSDDVMKYFDEYEEIIFDGKTQRHSCDVSFQCIPELMDSFDEIEKICEISDRNKITLLGFKKPKTKNAILDNVWRNIYRMRSEENIGKLVKLIHNDIFDLFQCDTKFLKNYPSLQKILNKDAYELNEGTFSCCINAINRRLYVSSYQLDHPYTLYKIDKNNEFFSYDYIENLRSHKEENPIPKAFAEVRKKFYNNRKLNSKIPF